MLLLPKKLSKNGILHTFLCQVDNDVTILYAKLDVAVLYQPNVIGYSQLLIFNCNYNYNYYECCNDYS